MLLLPVWLYRLSITGIGFQTMGFIINPAGGRAWMVNTQNYRVIAFREELIAERYRAPLVGWLVDRRGPRNYYSGWRYSCWLLPQCGLFPANFLAVHLFLA